MASIHRMNSGKGPRFRVQVKIAGFKSIARTFSTEEEAKDWGKKTEAEVRAGTVVPQKLAVKIPPLLPLPDQPRAPASSAKEITADDVRSSLFYEPTTGAFINRRTGSFIGWVGAGGYVELVIFGVKAYAHRVAWLMITGAWPDEDIDHINGDRSDNRLANLRSVTRSENLQNKHVSNGVSGLVGVGFHKPSGRWIARITKRRGEKSSYIGTFATPEEAREAYLKEKAVWHKPGVSAPEPSAPPR